MPEIALHQYENEIDQLIDEARYLEALAHTRHILSQHPRYVGAYYLLGKTLLEADQPELAIDMFHRALNADPEHLMARIGLMLAHQRVDNLNAAIWNLERAIELNPGDADLIDELRQLYGRRDGYEPERVPLNRASLARLYMRGNRPGRAAEELRALLAENPARIDLRLALAEAYWRDDQIVQASDTCQAVLDEMRYCLKANVLLGALWVDSGQEEGQVYLNRAQEIDLENKLANEMFGAASPLKLRDVKLQHLVYKPVGIEVDQQAKWFKRLEAASVIGGISEMQPDLTPSEARLVDITAGLEAQIELPAWLRELGTEEDGALSWMADVGAGAAAVAPTAKDHAPDWLRAEEAQEIAAGQELPDWLSSIATVGTPFAETAFAGEEPGLTEDIGAAAGLPDWLEELKPGAPTAETIPDWLQALQPAAAAAEEVPLYTDGLPDWLSELKRPSAVAEPVAETLPDWLEVFPAIEEIEEAAPEEELPDWMQDLRGAEGTAEPVLATEEGELPDWLTGFQVAETAAVEEVVPTAEVPDWLSELQPPAGITTDETLPDWLSELQPAEARAAEIHAAEELPDWLSTLQPAAQAELEAEAVEADLLDWLAEIPAEEEEAALTEEALPEWLRFDAEAGAASALADAEAPRAAGFFGWEAFGEEIAEVEAPVAEAFPAVEEGLLDWEGLAEQIEEGEAVAEAEAVAPTAEGDFMSGDDALAWLESLTVGKEDELRAQAEVETQARVAEILGRKVEAKPAEPAPVVEEPVLIIEEAALIIEEPAPAAGFFGWEAFGEEIAEVEAPVAEAFPAVEEGLLDWESLAEQIEAGEAFAEGEAVVPTAEGDFLSGDDALAWLESLAIGKEDELRAQAEVETQARVAEILGRKVEAKPAEPAPVVEEPVLIIEEAALIIEEPAPAAGFFGWEAFGEEIAEVEAPVAEAFPAVEEGLFDWEGLAEQIEEGVAEAEAVAPTAEGDFLSGDDALAWLESLAIGKEDELRAQAEVETQARVAEILGRKVEATPVEPAPVVKEPAPIAEGFFGWEAFGEEIAEVEAPVAAALPAEEEGLLDWEGLAEQIEEGEVVAEGEAVAPTAEGDFLSGDDALAWLESLAIGKEDELRAQAEVETQARVAEILGRKVAPAPEPRIVEPEPVVAETPVEEAAPPVEDARLSGTGALTWLESLAAGKEDELRAQAEVETQARVAEILGRKPAPIVAEPVPVVTEETTPAAEAPALAEVPTAEGDFMSGDDALAWLESLAAGKEDELRAQAEAETQARVAEILGRKPAPVVEAPAPAVEEPVLVIEELAVIVAEPEIVPTAPEIVPVALLIEPEPVAVGAEPGAAEQAGSLALARAAWKAGDVSAALVHYNDLIQAQESLDAVIADLQHAAAAQPNDPMLLQALGDAYMMCDMMDEALAVYNRAMHLL